MKPSFRLFLLLVFASAGLAQHSDTPQVWSCAVNGPVKSVELVRIYVRMNGRNIGERTERLNSERYNQDGKLVEEITYGKGYKRTFYTYAGDKVTAEVSYFDTAGNRIDEKPPAFQSNAASTDETGLCSKYSIRKENDVAAKITRISETCIDGSNRATTVEESDQRGELTSQTRTDAKGRSWVGICEYDSQGFITQYRFTVSVGPKPYTHTVNYSDHKFDDRGNWIRMTATAFISIRPGDLVYQYNESRSIAYYDPPTTRE